jgi:enoyl-CoA hydratase/carnithine racemase
VNYQNNLLRVEKKEHGVALVTLNNPPLNLITLDVSAELTDTMRKIDQDADIRVVVLTGSPGKAFCAGADIKEFPKVTDDVIGKKLKKENEALNSIEFLSKPVIAAMEGIVMGGGCELAMACDIRIVSETGKMSLPEINLGVFPGSGGLFRLPKLVGPSKAVELMYTGETLSPEQAREAGLVSRVVPAGQAVEAALKLAAQIAVKPAESLKLIKRGVREIGYLPTAECFDKNLDYSREIFQTPDCAEGVDAFLHKRPPRFQ